MKNIVDGTEMLEGGHPKISMPVTAELETTFHNNFLNWAKEGPNFYFIDLI